MALQALKCPECGADIQIDDSRDFGFCSFCGTKVMLKQIIEVHHKGLNTADIKAEQINEIKKISAYVNKRCEDYTELGSLRTLLATHKPPLFAQKITGNLGFVTLIIGIIGFVMWTLNKDGFPTISISCIIVGVLFDIINYSASKKENEWKAELINKINNRNSDLRKYYEDYGDCPIGIGYFCPATVDKLYGLIKNGRADTIKEAINVYEDDIHKGKMERAANIAAQNTAIAAKMATVTAINTTFRR